MRGKFVNLSLGIMNIAFGILILVFQLYVPQNLSELTIQENQVTQILNIAIKVILVIISIINIIALYSNRMEPRFKSGYQISLFALLYFILPYFVVSAFSIMAGIIIINRIIRENLIQIDSMFAISIFVLIIGLILALIILSFCYKNMGQYLYEKQNKDEQEYSEAFFKYITELDTQDVYINFKVDGKYRIYKSKWRYSNRL